MANHHSKQRRPHNEYSGIRRATMNWAATKPKMPDTACRSRCRAAHTRLRLRQRYNINLPIRQIQELAVKIHDHSSNAIRLYDIHTGPHAAYAIRLLANDNHYYWVLLVYDWVIGDICTALDPTTPGFPEWKNTRSNGHQKLPARPQKNK